MIRQRHYIRREGKVGKRKRLWRLAIRTDYVAKFGLVCQWCGRHVDAIYQLHTHHKVKRGLGGKDTEDNVMVICKYCHSLAHRDPGILRLFETNSLSVENPGRSYNGHG